MSILPGASRALHLLAEGRLSALRGKLESRMRGGLYREDLSYGLRRDLRLPFAAPQAKIPIAVREARASDADPLFSPDAPGAVPEEREDLAWRRELLATGLPTCFVAVDERDGTPCYAQWLMAAEQNDKIQAIGSFPLLQPGEALLENAYTPPRYRGFGIMPAAMALIAERAVELSAWSVITFVHHDNIPSLKGCRKAGFSASSRAAANAVLLRPRPPSEIRAG
jgi:hypothetical protein